MSVTTKMKTNLQTRVLFNFHVMEDMGQLLYRKVLIESESPCDVKMCEKHSCISNVFDNSFVLTSVKINHYLKQNNNEKILGSKAVCRSLLYECALSLFLE